MNLNEKAEARRKGRQRLANKEITKDVLWEAVKLFNETGSRPTVYDIARFLPDNITGYQRVALGDVFREMAQEGCIDIKNSGNKIYLQATSKHPNQTEEPKIKGRISFGKFNNIKDRNNEIIRLFKEGKTRIEISNDTGVTYGAVARLLYDNGFGIKKTLAKAKELKPSRPNMQTLSEPPKPEKQVGLIRRFFRWLY